MASRLFLRVSASLVGLLLLAGCITSSGGRTQCVTEVPADHTLIKTKLGWFVGGDYHPLLKEIRINSDRGKLTQEKALRHELCHVTEWRNCEALGTRTGWHGAEQGRWWKDMMLFNENCKEE